MRKTAATIEKASSVRMWGEFHADELVSEALASSGPDGFSAQSFAAHLANSMGRTIILVPWDLRPLKLFGVWFRRRTDKGPLDYIFYEQWTARIHQEHIILHELGHILLGHDTYELRGHAPADVPALARSISRSDDREAAAEAIATEIRQALIRQAGLSSLTNSESTAPGWDELARGLGY